MSLIIGGVDSVGNATMIPSFDAAGIMAVMAELSVTATSFERCLKSASRSKFLLKKHLLSAVSIHVCPSDRTEGAGRTDYINRHDNTRRLETNNKEIIIAAAIIEEKSPTAKCKAAESLWRVG